MYKPSSLIDAFFRVVMGKIPLVSRRY